MSLKNVNSEARMRKVNGIKKYLRSMLFNPQYISWILGRNVDDNHSST